MPAAKLTSPGQLVIPKPVRQHLRLQPGDRVDFVIRDDGEVVVQPVGDVRALKGILPKPADPVSLDEMNSAIRSRGRAARAPGPDVGKPLHFEVLQ